MSKGSRRFMGFLWAMLIAVISFFVIYIFFPDVSGKFFGVGIRGPRQISDKAGEIVDDVTDKVSDAILEKAVEKMVDSVKDSAERVVESVKDRVQDVVDTVKK